jgi:hypothetical protein
LDEFSELHRPGFFRQPWRSPSASTASKLPFCPTVGTLRTVVYLFGCFRTMGAVVIGSRCH